jgi:AAA domain (dynein-related subfamily)
MNINQLKRFLPYAIKANATVMIHGLHGIGKSQCVKQFAEENGMNFIDRRLSQVESGDLLGLPDVSGDVTKYKLPSWLPTEANYGKNSKGILFLDEINRARRDVLQGVFQLVLDRQLGDYTLPEGWAVVSAVNPNTDDYDVTNVFDEALMDRFLHIKLAPSMEEFLTYARSNKKAQQSFIDFLQINEDKLENSKLSTFTLERKPSRRSNLKAAELLALDLPEDLIIEGVGGLIGLTNVVTYTTWLKENDTKPFSGEEIVKKYDKILPKIKQYSDSISGRHDILSASLDNLGIYLKENYKKIKDDGYVNIHKFFNDCPKDLSVAFLSKLTNAATEDVKFFNDCVIPKILDTDLSDKLILSEKDIQFIVEDEAGEKK